MQKIYFLFLIASVIFRFNSFGQWNTNTAINTLVTFAQKSQQNIYSVSDTKGGGVIAWEDSRNNLTNSTDIYAQRIKANGFTKWTSNGVAICNNSFTQKSLSTTNAGIDGSTIIVWEDDRNGNFDIYAQKIDSSGNVLWASNGLAVCTRTNTQKSPKIVSDNAGGAIIVWEDSVNFYFDIYAQRINASGAVVWTTNGVAVCSAPNIQNQPRIDIDGIGGAIITWQDKRNNSDYDIYAQRLNSTGTVLWTANGVVVCNAINVQNNPRIEPDGASGALIGWTDKRNGLDYDIYSQHIDATGVVQWTTNGALVCNATNNQSGLDMKYLGSSGIIFSWKDDRSLPYQIYSQLLNNSGVPQLAANGIKLSNSLKAINPNTITDGLGGAIVVWQDSAAASGWNIKSQKLNSTGLMQWTTGGVNVSTAIDDQTNASQVTDGNGGAIYVWEDYRNGSDKDIYAHRLFFNGSTTVGLNELNKNNMLDVVCFPNPITTNSIIKLNNNKTNQAWDITIYDAFGKTMQTHLLSNNDQFEINASDLSGGIYFYFISLHDKSATAKGSFISVK